MPLLCIEMDAPTFMSIGPKQSALQSTPPTQAGRYCFDPLMGSEYILFGWPTSRLECNGV